MRGAVLRQRLLRRFRISLTDSNHDLRVPPKRLIGQPPPGKADTVWVRTSPVRTLQKAGSTSPECSTVTAAMESFWNTLKRELVHRREFQTRAEARTAIFGWIEAFCNRDRLHSTLGFQSPSGLQEPTQLNNPCLPLPSQQSTKPGQGQIVFSADFTGSAFANR